MRTPVQLTAFSLAERFLGTEEVEGAISNPQITAMLRLDNRWPTGDDVPWCSAFVNYVAWLLRLPRSKSLAARSWLAVGETIEPMNAKVGFDVVVIKRGAGPQPGPEVLKAQGHVGFFAGLQGQTIMILGGNQTDMVSIQPFNIDRLLGIRRL